MGCTGVSYQKGGPFQTSGSRNIEGLKISFISGRKVPQGSGEKDEVKRIKMKERGENMDF